MPPTAVSWLIFRHGAAVTRTVLHGGGIGEGSGGKVPGLFYPQVLGRPGGDRVRTEVTRTKGAPWRYLANSA